MSEDSPKSNGGVSDQNSLVRPKVTVRVPEIRLQLKDLAYLRSVSQPKGVRCHPGSSTIDRLRFLDLIARAKIPPSAETVAEIKKATRELTGKLKAALAAEQWSEVRSLAYELQRQKDRLEPSEDDVLTERGKQILQRGEVTVKVRKVGCV